MYAYHQVLVPARVFLTDLRVAVFYEQPALAPGTTQGGVLEPGDGTPVGQPVAPSVVLAVGVITGMLFLSLIAVKLRREV